MTDRRCGNCRHYKPARNPDTGRVLPSKIGACGYEVKWPTLPMCFRDPWRRDRVNLPRCNPVWRGASANDCPVWEAIPMPCVAEARQETMRLDAAADGGANTVV